MTRLFPKEFLLGAATSAYQIEGAVDADGRGESIWDRFAAQTGNVVDGLDGKFACDHYRRWRDDVKLMKWMGLHAYRFSVAWPRILPEGRGQVNERGLDFYERLVDELLACSIVPFVTLYHWDLPQALQNAGGWPARDTASAFADYADIVSRRLGDRVDHWITHNEPWCTAMHGHVHGEHAPGQRDWLQGLYAAHHTLLSHGWAVNVIRENAPAADVGITLNLTHCEAASTSVRDRNACRAMDGTYNRWFLDPLYGYGYPRDVVSDHIERGVLRDDVLPFVQPGDLSIISARTDFIGINYYTRDTVYADERGAPKSVPPPGACTDIGWEVYAPGMFDLLVRVWDEYRPARIYVTENGAAYHTAPDADGRVRDVDRQRYLEAHLGATLDARAAGVPVAGYFVWSLLDNYEWARGYTQRFGIVWVDFATQERVLKDSAHWYREAIATGTLPSVTG